MSEEIPSAKLTSTELKIQPGEDIVFYDGICGLCNKLVQFVITYGGASKFLFCSLQSETAKNLLAKYGEDNTLAKSIIVITQYNKPARKMQTSR